MQVERLCDFGFYLRLQISFLHVNALDRQHRLRADNLPRTVRLLFDAGAQAFMASDQLIETALQRRRVQPPPEAQGAGDMVGGAVRGQLPKEPLTLLGIRQRQRLVTTDRHQCGRLLTQATFQGEQSASEPFQTRLLEHQFERYFAPQRMPQA
ncbi:hypothetical protein [Pseudomonas sp. 58 R 3]|nr:hypothetical protein [Pseudomonas sp. 58 R 3]